MSGPMKGSGVDWAGVHRRIEAILRAAEGGEAASPEAAREVLEARARALAAPPPAPPPPDALELVTFVVAGETYALESRWVVEAARLERPTPLPGAAPPLFAVTAWRGELLGIHDLRAMLGLPPGDGAAAGWMMVLGDGAPALAVAADAPGDFRTVPAGAVRPPPAGGGPYVRGMLDDATVVLDGAGVVREAG